MFDFKLKEQLSAGQLLFPHLPVHAYAKKTTNQPTKGENPPQTAKRGRMELTHGLFSTEAT